MLPGKTDRDVTKNR